MARIKRVFGSTDEVAHVWAQQKQPEGRSGNVYFVNTREIYSYGSHFLAAMFHGDTVLINSHRYSSSTGKHLTAISSATRHKQRFEVPVPRNPKNELNYLKLINVASDAMEYFLGNQIITECKLSSAWYKPKRGNLDFLNEAVAKYNQYT